MSLIDLWAYLVLTDKSRQQPKPGYIERRKMEMQRMRENREKEIARRLELAIRLNERSLRRRGKPLFHGDPTVIRTLLGDEAAEEFKRRTE